MRNAVKAGAAYFGLVFALGFALGTLRVLFLAPRLGETGAVLFELPVMLGASWLFCGWLLHRLPVARNARARLVMGGTAFVLLMTAELLVGVLAFGRSIPEHFASYGAWSARVGLAAQLAFALLPVMMMMTGTAAPRRHRR